MCSTDLDNFCSGASFLESFEDASRVMVELHVPLVVKRIGRHLGNTDSALRDLLLAFFATGLRKEENILNYTIFDSNISVL
jgi:hypothetical protein